MAWGMKNRTIQLFGSSIIEGRIGVERAADRWYELMRSRLCELFPDTCFAVYNGAVGGKNTRELMAKFDRDLAGHTPDICIAMFGWNNWRMNLPPERRVSISELEELMADFPKHLPEQTRCIGVISQPLIDAWHESFSDPAYDPVRAEYGGVDAYHDREREAARNFFRRRGIPFVDLQKLMAGEPEKYIVRDGIHLSAAGHRLFAAAMVEAVAAILRDGNGSAATPR